MKLYKDLAEYYFAIESEHRKVEDDINLVKSFLADFMNPSILDLGCGTGEHLNFLKNSTSTCIGIDNSIEMLNIAKKRFPEKIEFIRKNFRNFDFYNEFDVIISLFGSMVYLVNDKDVDTFFWNTWRALKPGGIGIFEVWNSIPVKKIRSKPVSLVSKLQYKDTLIERERGFELIEDSTRTIAEVKYRYHLHRPDGTEVINDTHIMRAFELNEILKFIKENGLIVKNIYANSLKEPFNENSNKILIIFTKVL
jgi:SAM-dependent methyltransferase